MQIVARARDAEPARNDAPPQPRARTEANRAYRARLAALRTRAPDTLRARIRRELRAAAALTARR